MIKDNKCKTYLNKLKSKSKSNNNIKKKSNLNIIYKEYNNNIILINNNNSLNKSIENLNNYSISFKNIDESNNTKCKSNFYSFKSKELFLNKNAIKKKIIKSKKNVKASISNNLLNSNELYSGENSFNKSIKLSNKPKYKYLYNGDLSINKSSFCSSNSIYNNKQIYKKNYLINSFNINEINNSMLNKSYITKDSNQLEYISCSELNRSNVNISNKVNITFNRILITKKNPISFNLLETLDYEYYINAFYKNIIINNNIKNDLLSYKNSTLKYEINELLKYIENITNKTKLLSKELIKFQKNNSSFLNNDIKLLDGVILLLKEMSVRKKLLNNFLFKDLLNLKYCGIMLDINNLLNKLYTYTSNNLENNGCQNYTYINCNKFNKYTDLFFENNNFINIDKEEIIKNINYVKDLIYKIKIEYDSKIKDLFNNFSHNKKNFDIHNDNGISKSESTITFRNKKGNMKTRYYNSFDNYLKHDYFYDLKYNNLAILEFDYLKKLQLYQNIFYLDINKFKFNNNLFLNTKQNNKLKLYVILFFTNVYDFYLGMPKIYNLFNLHKFIYFNYEFKCNLDSYNNKIVTIKKNCKEYNLDNNFIINIYNSGDIKYKFLKTKERIMYYKNKNQLYYNGYIKDDCENTFNTNFITKYLVDYYEIFYKSDILNKIKCICNNNRKDYSILKYINNQNFLIKVNYNTNTIEYCGINFNILIKK